MSTLPFGVACIAGTLLISLLPASAQACTRFIPGSRVIDGTAQVANADPAGTYLSGVPRSGNAFAFDGCSGRQPIEIAVDLAGLSYVQDVEYQGLTYPAYGFGPDSPLLILRHMSGYLGGGLNSIPLRLGSNVDPNAPNPVAGTYRSNILVYVIARGGVMTSVPYAALGTITTWPQNFPALQNAIPVSIGIDALAPTCTLSSSSTSLDDVSSDALPAPGDSAGEKDVAVAMRCPGGGITIGLMLSDAHDPTNGSTSLEPAPGSAAQGVRIELLRNGLPQRLGQRWEHGLSAGGDEPIGLHARYLRTGSDIAPGDINGQAVLTADYR